MKSHWEPGIYLPFQHHAILLSVIDVYIGRLKLRTDKYL